MDHLPRKLVHRDFDDEGILEVMEDSVTRTLYFGSRAKQSAMLRFNPHVLVLSYTQVMTAALLFQPGPRSILLLGLGGGSLAKFFHHHFPDCRLLAVESRAQVTTIARDWFELPIDERLEVRSESALRYLETPVAETFDLVFVDIFSATGMDADLEQGDFFRYCRERLSPQGVLSANLWASSPGTCRRLLKQMRHDFTGQVLELPAPDCGNLIALGLERDFPVRRLGDLRDRADGLFQRFGIDYPDYLDRLRRRNRFQLRRLLR